MWWSSLLWAVPISFLLCIIGVALTFAVGLATDGYEHSVGDYLIGALASALVWGTLAFIGTCYVLIPVVATAIALVRYIRMRLT